MLSPPQHTIYLVPSTTHSLPGPLHNARSTQSPPQHSLPSPLHNTQSTQSPPQHTIYLVPSTMHNLPSPLHNTQSTRSPPQHSLPSPLHNTQSTWFPPQCTIYPVPSTMHNLPGPMPTLMMSAPLSISSSTISPVTTLPAYTHHCMSPWLKQCHLHTYHDSVGWEIFPCLT